MVEAVVLFILELIMLEMVALSLISRLCLMKEELSYGWRRL